MATRTFEVIWPKKKVKRKRWNSWRLIFCYWIVFKNIYPKKCIKDASTNKPNCLLWASCYFLFFFRLFVRYIFKKTKRYKAKEKKKELLWVNIRSVGNFLLILRDTLLGKTRSEVGNMCISSWFQLARWSTINWQQIGNVINPIIKFSKLVFASEMSCKLPWSILRVTRKSNRLF